MIATTDTILATPTKADMEMMATGENNEFWPNKPWISYLK